MVGFTSSRSHHVTSRTENTETARDTGRTVDLVSFVKREPFLFQILEYLLSGPIQYRVPIQPGGATRNAPEFWLHLRDGRFRPVRAFLPPDPARRQDHLIRKTIDQSPTDHRGF